MSDTPVRSLAKAVSWRVTGTVDTFLISWLITGEVLLASGIALTEIITKIFLFWMHVRPPNSSTLPNSSKGNFKELGERVNGGGHMPKNF